MSEEVRLENSAGGYLAVVRRRASLGELSRVVPDACGAAFKLVRARQIKGAGRLVAMYLDDVINLEIGVELDAPLASDGELIGSATPAGVVATAVHYGPYDRLCDTHNAIRKWCAGRGHSLAGRNWEIYAHWQDAWKIDPSNIRTDVYYLLADV